MGNIFLICSLKGKGKTDISQEWALFLSHLVLETTQGISAWALLLFWELSQLSSLSPVNPQLFINSYSPIPIFFLGGGTVLPPPPPHTHTHTHTHT